MGGWLSGCLSRTVRQRPLVFHANRPRDSKIPSTSDWIGCHKETLLLASADRSPFRLHSRRTHNHQTRKKTVRAAVLRSGNDDGGLSIGAPYRRHEEREVRFRRRCVLFKPDAAG